MFPPDVRLPEAAPRSPRRRQRWVQGIRETVSVSHLSTASPSKSHSHGHAHSPSPVHFAMQQWGRGSDERLLLATTPVLGGCSSRGAGFAQPLAQRCAPAQGLKLSSPTWLRPRHDGHESSPRRDPVLAGNPRRQELGGTLGCTQVIHVVFESRCLAHASPHFLSVMFCIM